MRGSTALRHRIASRVEDLDAPAWDSVVSKPLMRYEALRALDEVTVGSNAAYALVSDQDGPYAAISAAQSADLPFMITVAPNSGRSGGIQLRKGVDFDAALPRLMPTLSRMARRFGAIAIEVLVRDEECTVSRKHGFADFPAANPCFR